MSNNFNTNFKKEKHIQMIHTTEFYEILNYVYNTDYIDYLFICDDIVNLLINIKNKFKHEPQILTDRGTITGILIKLIVKNIEKNIMVKIPFGNVIHVIDDDVKTKELYEKVIKEQQKIYNYLLNENNKSRYNEQMLNWIYKNYPNIPLGECETVNKNDKIYGLDCSKAYTNCLMNLNFLIQIDFFEMPKIYDGHEINDYYIYKVEILETDDIFNMSYTNMFGFNLKQLKLEHKIIEYLEYTRIIFNKKCKNEIKKLYNSDLREKLCKFICNSSIGMTRKRISIKASSKIC